MTQEHKFAELLSMALKDSGKMLEAYRAFHNYSFGNMILAMFQADERGLAPINTYKGWQAMGRQVKKGEKAIRLCMPVINKRTDEETGEDISYTRFIYKPHWFFLHQTDGADVKMPEPEAFDLEAALKELNIERVPFSHINGNAQGYATPERQIAINPVAQLPFKTAIHEIAHIVCGHLESGGELSHGAETPRNIRELEAEGTAYLILASLNMDGAEYCRGYMQAWMEDEKEIPEDSAKRIMMTATKILTAGKPKKVKEAA